MSTLEHPIAIAARAHGVQVETEHSSLDTLAAILFALLAGVGVSLIAATWTVSPTYRLAIRRLG